jgi:hypothetical protein
MTLNRHDNRVELPRKNALGRALLHQVQFRQRRQVAMFHRSFHYNFGKKNQTLFE